MDEFRLKTRPSALLPLFEERLGCLDEFADADELHRVLVGLHGEEILECPAGLEIIVYPSSVEEAHVALITVFSVTCPNAHVVAASEEIRKLATSVMWEGADLTALTLEIVESAIALANGAVPVVRQIAADGDRRLVAGPIRCPRCSAEDCLRFEYRHDALGLDGDGAPVLAKGELTEIFCLACGEEVHDIEIPGGFALEQRPSKNREPTDAPRGIGGRGRR